MENVTVNIYTDGACQPNPGVGGWAAILVSPSHNRKKEITGAEPRTTNNRMELTAAIMALRELKFSCRVVLHTDSQYLKKAFTAGWISKWVTNGWVTSERTPVLNKDLWIELIRLTDLHDVKWVWVRGHSQNRMNTHCDELAVEARIRLANSLKNNGRRQA